MCNNLRRCERRRKLLKFLTAWSILMACSISLCASVNARVPPNEDNPFCLRKVRIIRSRLAIRFHTRMSSYRPGETAVFRIDNVGRISIGLIGEEFELERNENGRWKKDAASPDVFSKIRLGILGPGESGFCRSFPIPSDIAQGRYRFRKDVVISSTHRRQWLIARFDIR